MARPRNNSTTTEVMETQGNALHLITHHYCELCLLDNKYEEAIKVVQYKGQRTSVCKDHINATVYVDAT